MCRWIEKFLGDFNLSKRISDQLDSARNKLTLSEVLSFYDMLLQVIHMDFPELGLNREEMAKRIFNCDEICLMPDAKKQRVVMPKGGKHSHTQSNIGRYSITLLPCVSPGSGQIPPLLSPKPDLVPAQCKLDNGNSDMSHVAST